MKKITALLYKLIISAWKINPFKLISRNLLLGLKIPITKFYKDFRYAGMFYVKMPPGGFNIFNPGNATLENEIFWLGMEGWEKHSMHLWENLCKDSEAIFDIGANTGIYSLVACCVNPEARVFAFEPSRNTFELLKKNKAANTFNNLVIEKSAISNANGTATFYDFKQGSQYNASLNQTFSSYAVEEARDTYEVPTITFDNYLTQNGIDRCDLLKIDVELHEAEVLAGMKQTLLKYQPSFLIEILTEEVALLVQEILSGIDYLFFNIDEHKGVVQSPMLTKSNSYNFLVCKRPVAIKLRLIK